MIQTAFVGLPTSCSFCIGESNSGVHPDAITKLTSAPFLKGDAWRMQLLNSHLLPAVGSRIRLRAQLVAAERNAVLDFDFVLPSTAYSDTSLLQDARWKREWQQIELEIAASQLAVCAPKDRKESLGSEANLDLSTLGLDKDSETAFQHAKLDRVGKIAHATEAELAAVKLLDQAERERIRDLARWKLLKAVRSSIANYHANLPHWIESRCQEVGATGDEQDQTRLDAAARDLFLLEHRDSFQDPAIDVQAHHVRAGWHALLTWHGKRFLEAMDDAPARERQDLVALADHYRRLARRVSNHASLTPTEPPLLRIDAASDLALVTDRQGELEIEIESRTGSDIPVWFVVQYDANLLQVRPASSDGRFFAEHDLIRELQDHPPTANSGPMRSQFYPFRPDQMQKRPSLQLTANGKERFALNVARRNDARGDTKLIVKAVSGETYLRHEVSINLPSRAMFQLSVNRDPETFTTTGHGLVLHPLPNRIDEFTFLVTNETNVRRDVSVDFWLPSRNSTVTLPEGPITADVANNLLRNYGSRELLKRTVVTCGPSKQPTPVTFENEEPAPAEPERPSGDSADTSKVKGKLLAHGMLVSITDTVTKLRTLRRIQFAPQRPRRFLRARAAYDITTERLGIRLEAINRNAIPVDGLRIRCDFLGLSREVETLWEQLRPPSYEAVITTRVPAEEQRIVTIFVAVDDYPRGFVFQVPCRVSERNVAPITHLHRVRILNPRPNHAFKAPVASIPVEIQVDAPVGSFPFEGGGDLVEVGIDEDQDRELRQENTVRFQSDRQVRVHLSSINPDGNFSILAQVQDFQLDVPTLRLSNARANVLARVVVGGAQEYSQPVEVVFDGQGPRVVDVDVIPERTIPLGSEVEVVVVAQDWNRDKQLMSGVAKLSVSFDWENTGEFSKTPPPVEAKFDDLRGGWVASLVAKDLPVGRQKILIQAIDKVDIVGPYFEYPVEILAPQQTETDNTATTDNGSKTTPPKQIKNRILGTVRYGNEVVSRAVVTLQSETGAKIPSQLTRSNGMFSFPPLPPGSYTLNCRHLIKNGWRKADPPMAVNVSDVANTPTMVTVRLR